MVTLIGLQKFNDQKRENRLAGTESKVFEDILGGREYLIEVAQDMLMN